MSELLTLGDVTGRYQSRSEAAMAIALAAGNARWGIDDLRAALLDERNEGGAWLRVRKRNGAPRLDIELRLERLWRKAQQRIRERPRVADRHSVHGEIADIRLTMQAEPRHFAGAAGVTDHAVLSALLDVAGECLTLTPSASTRQLAERAGLSHQTVARSLRRLTTDSRYLRQEAPSAGVLAARYRLLRPEVDAEASIVRWESHRDHDAFAYRGLGRVAARLFDLIDGSTETELVELSGLHPRTVRRHLRRMAAVGVIRRAGGRWSHAGDLDAAADTLHTTGTGQARKARHQAEREAWIEWKTEFDAKRGWRVQRGLHNPLQRLLPLKMAA